MRIIVVTTLIKSQSLIISFNCFKLVMAKHMEEKKHGEKVMIAAAAWNSKYSSKKENYDFLTIECKAWLPSYETVTIYFLKDLINGPRKCKSR